MITAPDSPVGLSLSVHSLGGILRYDRVYASLPFVEHRTVEFQGIQIHECVLQTRQSLARKYLDSKKTAALGLPERLAQLLECCNSSLTVSTFVILSLQ